MTYKILVNGNWNETFEGTKKEVEKFVEGRQNHEHKSGWNRKVTYELK